MKKRENQRNTVVLSGDNEQHMELYDYLMNTGLSFSGGLRGLAYKGMKMEKIQQKQIESVAILPLIQEESK